MKRGPAPAKINLALVVGPKRSDGRHELLTIYQRVSLSDHIAIQRAPVVTVSGFEDDTLVRRALAALADDRLAFSARIRKRIPVAGGLGGGSSDAATALRFANDLRAKPHDDVHLQRLARELGADIPFFLLDGPQLGSGDGTALAPVELPQDYWVLLALPRNAMKSSTCDVFAEFDARNGERGFETRRESVLNALRKIKRPRDLALLPKNDLAQSSLAEQLEALGAFRADVTGAGPTVYGLFLHGAQARAAQKQISPIGRTWLTAPAWYR